MPKPLKIILLVLGFLVLAFLVSNAGYFWQRGSFSFSKPPQISTEADSQKQTAEPDRLWIPSLGIEAPLIYATEVKEDHFQEQLEKGVVHYPGTALPGQLGNAYIFGHSSDYFWRQGDYKTVFALLPEIELGAEIILTDSTGNIFRYAATNKFVANPEDLHLLAQDETKRQLTLQTSYPIGTALKRYIVQAELQE